MTTSTQVQQWHTLEDGFDNLTRGTAPMPTPGKDEVLVEIKAVSINYRDTEGMSPLSPYSRHLLFHTSSPIQPYDAESNDLPQ